MDRRVSQVGASKVGCLLALLVVIVTVLVLVKTVPVVVNVGEFQSEIETLAERASLYPNKKIEGRLLMKAGELHLPVQPDQIEIRRSRQEITVHVEYDLVLNYPFYTYTWHKVHHVVRPLF